jgi:DNA-damage-inducible protein D
MKKEMIVRLHSEFEATVHTEGVTGIEYWYARELQGLLGYSSWRSFEQVAKKAVSACEKSGYEPGDHFVHVHKMVEIGSGAEREIDDIALTRYACYLIAQNGDPSKEPIAFAQTYFAVQTRKQELIEQRLAEVERLTARKKLSTSEKLLSGVIYENLGDDRSFARIRSKGDQALFGGQTTQKMKARLKVPKSRPLADFLPTITIKAKDFANEVTIFNVKRDDLDTEARITAAHVRSNEDVRGVLTQRGIRPEELPPAEDVKKVERRLTSAERKLPKDTNRLSAPDSDE